MTLRTPRRRISPQTRRRCRAIKGFFKRALGSLSQPDLLQITSSIAVNVTDINHKIVGLEQQLNRVCMTCRDQRATASGTKLKGKQTNVIYAKPESQYQSSTPSSSNFRTIHESNEVSLNAMNNTDYSNEYIKNFKNKKSKVYGRENCDVLESECTSRQTESSHKNILSSYSTSSFHSLDQFKKSNNIIPGFSGNLEEKKTRSKVQKAQHTNRKQYTEIEKEKPDKSVKTKIKHRDKVLDADFIADIIKRQYRPVKLGRRSSDLSQFSAPVCRDREFCLPAECYNIPEEQYPCNCRAHHNNRCCGRHSDFSDIKSVCETRVYNVRQNHRTKHHRRHAGAYDNSDFYDLVPVKEKSSPKSRRKFFEDNMRSSFKEVPPSPRTQRPQLNLKSRYADSDSNVEFSKNTGKKGLQKHIMRYCEMEDKYHRCTQRNSRKVARQRSNDDFDENYNHAEILKTQRTHNQTQAELQCPNSVVGANGRELTNDDLTTPIDSPLNKTQETLASDKTDKALSEIKDILQNFLQEIKKDTSSHNHKSNVSTKMTESGNSPVNNVDTMTSNRHSFNDFNPQCPVPPSPYMPTLPNFGNTCCYPIMPICPINCMQNGYAMPSASFTHNCVDKSNETSNSDNNIKINKNESCETDELIKEIYKFVSQSPTFCKKNSDFRRDTANTMHTSRSAGGSTRVRRHNAKVGTPKMKCVSKSCEAIKLSSDLYSSDTSYSDTVLDRLSLENTETYSDSDSEYSTEISEESKAKKSKFFKVLKSIGISKKTKNDVVEDLHESHEEVKKKSPYRQNIVNYAVHGQEHYKRPPLPTNYRPEYQDYRPPYNPGVPPWDPRLQSIGHRYTHSGYQNEHYPSAPPAPPYSQPYNGYQPMQPQVPLCLKEVEVKSIACQSEKKLSFFRKFAKIVQPPVGSSQDDSFIKNDSTQTPQIPNQIKQPKMPALFNWKNTHSGYMDKQINPLTFGLQTQQKLAQGDVKMRNAMLKKMFNKRNPFSPRNLIVRTLLGKDKSSYGNPPTSMTRPRLFM